MHFSEYIENNGIDPKKIAKKLDVTPATIYAWMAGKTLPKFPKVLEIDQMTCGAVSPMSWTDDNLKPIIKGAD